MEQINKKTIKVNNNDIASICVKKDGKPYFTCEMSLRKMLRDFIITKMYYEHNQNKPIEKFETSYITINQITIPEDTLIKVKFKIFKYLDSQIIDSGYERTLKVKDFYNSIIKIVKYFSKKFDITFYNVEVEVLEINILEGDLCENKVM